MYAVIIPVTRFVAPGPEVARHTPTRPDTREHNHLPHVRHLFMTDEVMFNFREAIYFIIELELPRHLDNRTYRLRLSDAMFQGQCVAPLIVSALIGLPFTQLFRQYFAGI